MSANGAYILECVSWPCWSSHYFIFPHFDNISCGYSFSYFIQIKGYPGIPAFQVKVKNTNLSKLQAEFVILGENAVLEIMLLTEAGFKLPVIVNYRDN